MTEYSSINEFLTCRLCDRFYREAHTIPECLHTFCKDCLHEAFKHQPSLAKKCPEASCQTQIPRDLDKQPKYDRCLQDCVNQLVPYAMEKVREDPSLILPPEAPTNSSSSSSSSSSRSSSSSSSSSSSGSSSGGGSSSTSSSSSNAAAKGGQAGGEKVSSILDQFEESNELLESTDAAPSPEALAKAEAEAQATKTKAKDDDAMDVDGGEGPPPKSAKDKDESEGMERMKESRRKMARKTCCYLSLAPKENSVRVGGKSVNLKTINAKAFLHNKVEDLAKVIKATFGARVERLACSLYDGEKKLDGHEPLLYNAIMRGFAGHTKDSVAFVDEDKLTLQLTYSLE